MTTPSNALIRKLLPWEENPYHPVSFDMFVNAAHLFWAIGQMLETLWQEALTKPHGDLPIPYDAMHAPVDSEMREKARRTFDLIRTECPNVGMPITAETAEEYLEKLDDPKYDLDMMMKDSRSLQHLIQKEAKKKLFLYMTPERVQFWPRTDTFIFGEKVGRAFPSASFDIVEAASCVAIARGTACVFHLMRALEVVLGVMGAKFGVSTAHSNWGNAIDQIESKIGEMGDDKTWRSQADWKDQQEFYAQAVSHLRIVKDAWRNYTAHARGKFTEEEAQDMFKSVKRFMQKLSERLSE